LSFEGAEDTEATGSQRRNGATETFGDRLIVTCWHRASRGGWRIVPEEISTACRFERRLSLPARSSTLTPAVGRRASRPSNVDVTLLFVASPELRVFVLNRDSV
jgi:hypothetical protein